MPDSTSNEFAPNGGPAGGGSSRVPIGRGRESGTMEPRPPERRETESDVPAETDAPQERYLFTPPIDIFETEEGLVLHADLPGVTLETLELQVQDNRLTLFGRVNSPIPDGAIPRYQEYAIGDFLRSFILSDEVDHERISATLNNGVLKVVLPKAPQPEPRRIPVSAE